MPGLIACDFDGTLTDSFEEVPLEVLQFLREKQQQGWQLAFLTGRSFNYIFPLLSPLDCPYFLAVQNGALLLKMPERAVIARSYIDKETAIKFHDLCREHAVEGLFYGGLECDDKIFIFPQELDSSQLSYIKKRAAVFKEQLIFAGSFEQLPTMEFASVKCFTGSSHAQVISASIAKQIPLYLPVIQDPFSSDYFVLQGTSSLATKGVALLRLVEKLGIKDRGGKIIAAGDDYNDLEMFAVADISIAMSTAPEGVKQKASFIAPAARELGIIEGLTKALNL